MSATHASAREMLDQFGENQLRRRLIAERIFRELRKGEPEVEKQPSVIPLPRLSPTLR